MTVKKKNITKKSKTIIPPKNLIVELYKIKFEKLKPYSDLLHDYQVNKIINHNTAYAHGLSNGFDVAIDCFLEVYFKEK